MGRHPGAGGVTGREGAISIGWAFLGAEVGEYEKGAK